METVLFSPVGCPYWLSSSFASFRNIFQSTSVGKQITPKLVVESNNGVLLHVILWIGHVGLATAFAIDKSHGFIQLGNQPSPTRWAQLHISLTTASPGLWGSLPNVVLLLPQTIPASNLRILSQDSSKWEEDLQVHIRPWLQNLLISVGQRKSQPYRSKEGKN